MNRRSKSVKIEKFCLVRFLVDNARGVLATDSLSADQFTVGGRCEAEYKSKMYEAVILAMNGKF